ncbi:hypothetical protein ACIA6E_16675 [Streptomyces sp. NPDC051815]|uniref:hypothetical protein n=1 Tax=Streptomyces sp. NPDC051815 TaxID=3365674 RepID=UPI0037AC9B0A
MSDAWSWHYNPDARHVVGGLRTLDIFGGRGFLMFLAPERLREISVVRVVWLG